MFGGVSAWMGDRQGLTSRDFYRRFALKLGFAESSTALRNISARLVQQTLRTVSIVFLTLLDFVRTFVLFTLIILTVLT